MNDYPMPTTAREALDLAWELAHPIQEGQVTPKGTRAIDRKSGMIVEYVAGDDWTPRDHENIRTLDPLPDPEPEPDWLYAPAVLARPEDDTFITVWQPCVKARCAEAGHGERRWLTPREGGICRSWRELRDVTPLYPKEGA